MRACGKGVVSSFSLVFIGGHIPTLSNGDRESNQTIRDNTFRLQIVLNWLRTRWGGTVGEVDWGYVPMREDSSFPRVTSNRVFPSPSLPSRSWHLFLQFATKRKRGLPKREKRWKRTFVRGVDSECPDGRRGRTRQGREIGNLVFAFLFSFSAEGMGGRNATVAISQKDGEDKRGRGYFGAWTNVTEHISLHLPLCTVGRAELSLVCSTRHGIPLYSRCRCSSVLDRGAEEREHVGQKERWAGENLPSFLPRVSLHLSPVHSSSSHSTPATARYNKLRPSLPSLFLCHLSCSSSSFP